MRASVIIAELLRAGKRVRFRARGSSMLGAIRSGDVVEVEPIKIAQLQRGDIVLYQRHGRLVAHRLLTVLDVPSRGLRLIVRGDNHDTCDRPVPAYAVLGRVTQVNRDLSSRVRSLGRSVHQFWQASVTAALG